MKKIKYGYIAPIAYQHLIPDHADFHLILAHLLDNKEYVDFYKEKIKRGDVVILDNSAFEFKRALSAEEIFGFIERSGIEPTYVVAPDYPFEDWEVTWESTLKFIEEVIFSTFRERRRVSGRMSTCFVLFIMSGLIILTSLKSVLIVVIF